MEDKEMREMLKLVKKYYYTSRNKEVLEDRHIVLSSLLVKYYSLSKIRFEEEE